MIYCLYYKNNLILKYTAETKQEFRDYLNSGEKESIIKTIVKKNRIKGFDKRDFNKIINGRRSYYKGLSFRVYRDNEKVQETIKSVEHKREKKLKTYNYFYVFDIETSHISSTQSVSYLYGIRKYNFSIDINDDNLEEYAEEYKAFYSVNAITEFAYYLKDINNKAEQDNKLIYIYCHNMIFELYELIQNIFIQFNITEDDIQNCINNSCFRGAPTKPLFFRFKNIMFVDSLALTNKSLAKISLNHKIKKLVENKTYKERYFFGSNLPEKELEYNKNDLDVTALGVLDMIKQCKGNINTFNDFVKLNVNTVTGLSKHLNKNIHEDKESNDKLLIEHTNRASKNLPKNTFGVDKERLLFYQSIFQGGYTHGNIFYTYTPL